MSSPANVPSRRYEILLFVVMALSVWIYGGCSDDDDDEPNPPGGPTSTTFTGFMANGVENGSVTVTINSTSLASPFGARPAATNRLLLAPSVDVAASGVFEPIGGASVSLSGMYEDQGDTLNLSGGGYSLRGVYDTTGTYHAVLGQYNGPNGPGIFGSVTGITNPTIMCGTFDSDVTTTTGNWNILVTGGEVAGLGIPTSGDPFGFEGTIETTGTQRAITAGDSDPGVYTLTVTGTLDTTTNTVSGTWTYEDHVTPSTDSGTWSGSPCP
jgi:hypothetical protein